MKYLFNILSLTVLVISVISCNKKNDEVLKSETKNSITIIFGKRSYEKDTLRFLGGGYSPTNDLIKINTGSYELYESLKLDNEKSSDTLTIYNTEDITLEHKYHYYYTSVYKFKPGDFVKIDYSDGIPEVKILNRKVNKLDLNFQTEYNINSKRPISREEFYLNNKRFRNKEEIEDYNNLMVRIEKRRIFLIDSLKNKNLISKNAYNLISDYHKFLNPNLYFKDYDAKLGIDSLLNLSSYKNFRLYSNI